MKVKKKYFFIVLVVLIIGVLYVEPLSTYAVMLFRNPLCSFTDGLNGLSYEKCENEKKESVKQSCRLLKTDENGLELWETLMGDFWMPHDSESVVYGSGGLSVVASIVLQQTCNVYGDGENGVQPGDIVLDCGAHAGIFTRKALDAGAQLVVAIEPSPEQIECLRRNFVEEIKSGLVIVYQKGVWDKDDELKFKIQKVSGGNRVDEGLSWGKVEKIVSIPVTTIDKIVAELGLEKVDYIKMDIEGAEQNALKGARQTISSHHPRMAIATEHGADFLKNAQGVASIIEAYSDDYSTECCGPYVTNASGLYAPEIVLFK